MKTDSKVILLQYNKILLWCPFPFIEFSIDFNFFKLENLR